MSRTRCPECNDGIVGYAQQEHSTAINPIFCSNCGGTGWLDDMVYNPPVKAKACWYCRGIEDHKIVSVKTVVDEFGRELPAYDTPYNFCPNCGKRV